MRIDTLTMFTSEIEVVEINTLRENMTLVIPSEFEVSVDETDTGTLVHLYRKSDEQ